MSSKATEEKGQLNRDSKAQESENSNKASEEQGICFYIFVFILTCGITFGCLTLKTHYDKWGDFNDSSDAKGGMSLADCPWLNKKPENEKGIQHCVINSPFNEEIYKYNFWPNYKEFNETYNGKFEIVERQMSHPINITFYDKDWKEVEVHTIHEMPAEEIANLIRSKGFVENPDKEAYRNSQKDKLPLMLEETRKKVKELLENGSEEEIKAYEQALSALSISKEEFLNPEEYKQKKIDDSLKRHENDGEKKETDL